MSIQVDKSSFRCSHPIRVGSQMFSCGHCIACRSSRINEWSVRLSLENSTYKNNSIFVTLTYNQENLKYSTLDKSDLQKFFKRLRYYLKEYYNISDISYFACGEYGSQNYRPHFHFILFGVGYSKLIKQLIFQVWKKGFVKVKPTIKKNFYYVAKYNVKTLNKSVDGVPEFTVMSRRKAIGSRYIADNIDKIKDNKFKIKIGKREVFAPKSILRKKYKDLLDSSRFKICNFLVPDWFDISEKNVKRLYNKYVSDCIYYNFDNKFTDFNQFRFFHSDEFKYMIDLNCNREREFCTKKFINRYNYYKNSYFYFGNLANNFIITDYSHFEKKSNDNDNITKIKCYSPFYDSIYFISYEYY